MMDTEQTLLDALSLDPGDHACWLALADCLEDQGQVPQAELLRLRLELLQAPQELPDPSAGERRLQHLLASGVLPHGPRLSLPLGNNLKLSLVLIPPGRFYMGSPPDEEHRMEREGPRHLVTISRGFWLASYPVTQIQWQALLGDDPSEFSGPNRPVERITWNETRDFLAKLSSRTDRVCRLPTEAEWEFACRAGTTTPFHTGDTLSARQANYDGNFPYAHGEPGPYRQQTTPVGMFLPNALGLFDMHGNVDEWCEDSMRRYTPKPVTDPRGRRIDYRCIRGGSWYGLAQSCRSACRYDCERSARSPMIGFRVLVELE